VWCRRGGFIQLCNDLCWRRVMAASCSGSEDHIRDVALNVAARKVESENDIYTFKRPDYTAEEWRLLFLTTGSDYYLNILRLVGFCGVDGINWAVVTRMREVSNPSRENFLAILPEDCRSILHYMRPQFRFLIYIGRDDKRVNLDSESVRFYDDVEKVVSGDAIVWGSPVVVDGVPLLPDVECLVSPWLRQEFLVRTSDLDVSEGQHYVYPGVRGPLLLPLDYIRKYFYIELVYLFSIWCFSIVFVILIFYYSCDSGAV
jgi:hypothetical protein